MTRLWSAALRKDCGTSAVGGELGKGSVCRLQADVPPPIRSTYSSRCWGRDPDFDHSPRLQVMRSYSHNSRQRPLFDLMAGRVSSPVLIGRRCELAGLGAAYERAVG